MSLRMLESASRKRAYISVGAIACLLVLASILFTNQDPHPTAVTGLLANSGRNGSTAAALYNTAPLLPPIPLPGQEDEKDGDGEGSRDETVPTSDQSILVIPYTGNDNISWVQQLLPDWPKALYQLENPTAPYRVPVNRGLEVMAYLSYIIDHYDALPETVLFFRARRVAEYNNLALDNDAAQMISRLSLERVKRHGYVNARCHSYPGCPEWILIGRPEIDRDDALRPAERHFTRALWKELFPGETVPVSLSGPTGSQFGVSRRQIRSRPRQSYLRIRSWLQRNSSLDDKTVSDLFSHLWPYVFTGQASACPAESSCHCDGYRLCFGGQQKLAEWLDVYATAADRTSSAEQSQDTSELVEWLTRKRAEAFEAGRDSKKQEIEAELVDLEEWETITGLDQLGKGDSQE